MKFRRACTLAAAASLLLTGCGALNDESAASGPQVAAAFYPLEYVADRVLGERGAVVNLTTPGGEPHDLELTIKETSLVVDADLVILERGFQPAVDTAVEENADGKVLDAAEVVGLQPVAAHDETEDEEGHGHDSGDLDPHFWLDPLRMAELGDAVAGQLTELDPDHADDYAGNAADLRRDLEALDATYADSLASCDHDTVVVNHDAFGYLGKYGLHVEPIVGLSPDAEPTPGDLSRLQTLIRDEGITTVFSESLVSPKTAQTLAADLGIEAEVLDPIEGLSEDTADEDYLSIMRRNLALLVTANGCR